MRMGIPVFGNNPRELLNEDDHNKFDQSAQTETLKAEIVLARKKLQDAEARMAELQKKLDESVNKERQIAEIMIVAQINAQRTEAQARVRAEELLQEKEEELRLKQQELELLKLKAHQFKDSILDRLDQYKATVESIMEDADHDSFAPTLVARDKKNDHKRIG